MKQIALGWLALGTLCVASFVSAGCSGGSSNDDGLTAEQKASGDRTAEIIKSSGGDWTKLSTTDKDYLLKLANGNERAAHMRFQMLASRTAGGAPPVMPGPGGMPPGGPGGGTAPGAPGK